MHMKKAISLFMATVMAFLLTACGNQTANQSGAAPENAGAAGQETAAGTDAAGGMGEEEEKSPEIGTNMSEEEQGMQAAPDAIISDQIFDCYEEEAASSEEGIRGWLEGLGFSSGENAVGR